MDESTASSREIVDAMLAPQNAERRTKELTPQSHGCNLRRLERNVKPGSLFPAGFSRRATPKSVKAVREIDVPTSGGATGTSWAGCVCTLSMVDHQGRQALS